MVNSFFQVCEGIKSENDEKIKESLQLFRTNINNYDKNQMDLIINDIGTMLFIIETLNNPAKILSNMLDIFENDDNKIEVYTNSISFISGLLHVLNIYLKDDERKSYLINAESMYYTLLIINNMISGNINLFFNTIAKDDLNELILNIGNRIEHEFSYCIQELLLEFLCRISYHYKKDTLKVNIINRLLPRVLSESFQDKEIGPIKIIKESRKYLNLMNIHNNNIISIQATSCFALVNDQLDEITGISQSIYALYIYFISNIQCDITDDKYYQVSNSKVTNEFIIISNSAWFTIDKDEIMIEINR